MAYYPRVSNSTRGLGSVLYINTCVASILKKSQLAKAVANSGSGSKKIFIDTSTPSLAFRNLEEIERKGSVVERSLCPAQLGSHTQHEIIMPSTVHLLISNLGVTSLAGENREQWVRKVRIPENLSDPYDLHVIMSA